MTSTTTIRKSYGNRKLYSFPEDYPLRLVKPRSSAGPAGGSGSGSGVSGAPKKSEDVVKLLKYVDDNIVGKNNAFPGPFGRRKVVFCDYIASGRSLQFIEEYIVREVLPCFGSTHSTTNITSLQTSLFRHEAREIIRGSVNASDDDVVLFTRNGCSGAFKKLLTSLDLREPPVIFTCPTEDYENLLKWREIGAKIVRIAENKEGMLDLADLEEQLKMHQAMGRLLIGCFSLASNVTGIIIDEIASTLLLHQYGALAFWNYDVAAPSVSIDMNPVVPGVEEARIRKDAIYFSFHKFVGGVQTPGVLVVRKSIFKNCGFEGVDSFFEPQERNKNFEQQEEGSSPEVVESIRAGLVMQLKETITVTNIMQRCEKITKQMLLHIRTTPEIILLGNKTTSSKRLPVFSFIVRHPRGTFLHHNFVCAVLNDVFGIQARGGNACSGPYLQDLLGIDQNLADQYENIILEDRRLSSLSLSMQNSTLELLRPGFTRISLPYFINDVELGFVMEAVKMVATESWKLLPQYVVDLDTGEWRHHSNSISKDRKWLGSIRYIDGKMTMNERRVSGPGMFPQNYSECLQTARNLFNRARRTANRNPYPNDDIHFDIKAEKLRWFMLPREAQELLTSNSQNVKHCVPFDPVAYAGSHRTSRKLETINFLASATVTSPCHGMGTRHYSLPAIDDPRLNGTPPPLSSYFIAKPFQATMAPQISQSHYVHGPPNFAVGECVNSAIFNPIPAATMFQRERCMSLGDTTVSPPPPPAPLLSPQTRASLGINVRKRNCSCSSQTDLHSLESDSVNLSPTHSLNILYTSANEISQYGRASPAPSVDLHAYVSEISKELATSIKSEIREVINKVEDVLENTDSVDMSFMCNERHGSGSEDGRDSISANDVAEYLEKVSREMANEVKSEIRDVVSAVDVFITPDSQERHSFSRASSAGDSEKFNVINTLHKCISSSSAETELDKSNSSTSGSKFSDEELSDRTNKPKLLPSTVTSVSSQDSGINLSFHDQEYFINEFSKKRSSSESSATRQMRQESEKLRYSTLQRQNKSKLSEQIDDTKLPNNIWQPSVEAIEEYEMIKDGDKIMVCLSGGKDSLTLLHALLQYQRQVQDKGMFFSLGAVTVGPVTSGCDPSFLPSYLKQLGVNYVIEEQGEEQSELGNFQHTKENLYSFSVLNRRHRIYDTAKNCGYNVLAVGQHLDDLCESFILSIFHTGKLKTMKAHYRVKDFNLRVIRPLVYVREKSIRNFVAIQKLPTSIEINYSDNTKERQRTRQMLAQQEILYPQLYANIRSAMHSIIGLSHDDRDLKSDSSENETDEDILLKAD